MVSALGVASAVAVARALKAVGLAGIGLKWPNDILWGGRKLGGVLVEVADAKARPCRGVIGVGLNVHMPADAARSIDQPWTDVRTALGGDASRNQLAAALLVHLLAAIAQFQATGLAFFIEEWRQCDIMPGKTAVLRWHNGHVTGVVEGIDALGELLLSVGGELQRYCYGEVSLRPEPGAGAQPQG
jgi:BirA family biotin operon repressor/biotin-[acetyl-CoA-carboxylase] ligase